MKTLRVTMKNVAEKLSMPLSTVQNCMNTNPNVNKRYSPNTVSFVRDAAAKMGYVSRKEAVEANVKTWYGSNFKTKEDMIARMKELRGDGYSNAEIARKIGVSWSTVLRNIGKQDTELSRQNVVMARRIRAQKDAARKQYVLNKPIREYNAKVERHNKMKAELKQMEAELRPQTPMIQQAAQMKIDFPLVDLKTVQPTALQ